VVVDADAEGATGVGGTVVVVVVVVVDACGAVDEEDGEALSMVLFPSAECPKNWIIRI